MISSLFLPPYTLSLHIIQMQISISPEEPEKFPVLPNAHAHERTTKLGMLKFKSILIASAEKQKSILPRKFTYFAAIGLAIYSALHSHCPIWNYF